MKLTIGADPEVFVKLGSGKFISGHVFECGTKSNPMPVANGHVQVDGMALEFNVKPSETKSEFVNSTIRVIKDLTALVQAKEHGATLAAIPCCDFGEEYIKSVPLEASQLGCNPDFNAYSGETNPIPDANMPFRTGSGHVHIGWTTNKDPMDPEHYAQCRALVKELDYYLGLPSLLWDADNRRRELYGQAGAFRPKNYGLEYRVLSNAWLKRRDLMEFVFERAQTATLNTFNGRKKPLHARFGELARTLINSQSVEAKTSWPTSYQAIAAMVLDNRRILNAAPSAA